MAYHHGAVVHGSMLYHVKLCEHLVEGFSVSLVKIHYVCHGSSDQLDFERCKAATNIDEKDHNTGEVLSIEAGRASFLAEATQCLVGSGP